MGIEVIKPGLATTVQDLGRPGYYDIGIPLSGAMDRFALRAGNLLVGNDEGAAALECTFMGPELAFTSDAVVAVTGAELPPKLDDGSIQVPGGTEPIVLHRDAVSGGGYVHDRNGDLGRHGFIGQLQPHAKVRFVSVTMDEALAARRERQDTLAIVRALLV